MAWWVSEAHSLTAGCPAANSVPSLACHGKLIANEWKMNEEWKKTNYTGFIKGNWKGTESIRQTSTYRWWNVHRQLRTNKFVDSNVSLTATGAWWESGSNTRIMSMGEKSCVKGKLPMVFVCTVFECSESEWTWWRWCFDLLQIRR